MEDNSSSIPFTVTEAEAFKVSRLWPAILYTSLMMVVSAMGNTMVCYVYGFRWQSTVTKTFIFSLGALDLTNSLICMPTEIAMLVKIMTFDAPWWCKISRFLTYTLNGSSSLILVAIALDRWYKVYRPLKCFFTQRRAKRTCVGAVVLAASLSWPALVLYGNFTLPLMGTDATAVMCLVSDDYIDTWWPLVFYCVYFLCYLCLVVAITVLYSMIAVRLLQLKRRQKERLALNYAGLRSSKLVFPSQDSMPLTGDNPADQHGERGEGHAVCPLLGQEGRAETENAPQTYAPGVTNLQNLPEENERRRSVTFRLPRKCTTTSEEKNSEATKEKAPNGIRVNTPEIVINENVDEEQASLENSGEEPDPDEDTHNTDSRTFQDRGTQPPSTADDPAVTKDDMHGADTLHADMTRFTDVLQASECSDDTQLLPTTGIHSCTDSHGDTDEFEEGIHFTAQDDLAWQHNPITADSQTPDAVDDPQDGTVTDLSSDTLGDELGSNSSLLSGKTKRRATKSKSDSYTLSVPESEGDSGKPKVHKTSSDSNLVIPEKHHSLTSARRSFLMLPGGYPGGHTPTSRLPTPTDTPNATSTQARPVLLSSKLILEKLNKKMAYRPAKTTRMLFAISIVFVISFLPFFCIVIIRAVQGRAFFANLTDAAVLAICVFIRSSCISNAANPVIYGLCNKQFRTECGFLFKKCSNKRREVTLRVIEATDDVLGSNS